MTYINHNARICSKLSMIPQSTQFAIFGSIFMIFFLRQYYRTIFFVILRNIFGENTIPTQHSDVQPQIPIFYQHSHSPLISSKFKSDVYIFSIFYFPLPAFPQQYPNKTQSLLSPLLAASPVQFYYRNTESIMKLQVNCDYNQNKGKQGLYKQSPITPDLPLEDRQFEVIQRPNIRLYCSACELELTRAVLILTKNDYYCVGCFANLEEYPPQYLVRSALKKSPTSSNWDLMDEVVLITAFKLWGYSNWAQIKDYMNYNQTPFTLQQIQQHFEQHHYNQPGRVISIPSEMPQALPHPLYGQQALQVYEQALKQGELKRRDSKGLKKINSMKSLSSLEAEQQRGVKPSSAQQLHQKNQQQGRHIATELHNQYSVLGYNSKRGQFQTFYYDLEAERMLEQLEFYDNDSPEQYALKIQLIQNYNRRLDERANRKHFTLQYKLLDSHYQFAQKPEQQKAVSVFQPFMRYTAGHLEYRQLLQDYSTLKKQQQFMVNLNSVRTYVAKSGEIEDAYSFLATKRRKCIEQWEKLYNKPFPDKRRRKIYHRQNLQTGDIIIREENQEGEEQSITFNQIQNQIAQYLQGGNSAISQFKITPLISQIYKANAEVKRICKID